MPLTLDRQFSFDNFFSTRDGLIVASLKDLIRGEGEFQLGLWGATGSGKTHLLNASAEFARRHSIGMQIYDAAQLAGCDPDGFEGFDQCQVLAIDNLDLLAGRPEWEACFYRVINRFRDGEHRFLFTLRRKPEDLATHLEDFRSRLQWGLLLQLPDYDDAELRSILGRRSRLLGVELSAEVTAYLLTRFERNLGVQMQILKRLDDASMSHQRRITIPLVKEVMGKSGE